MVKFGAPLDERSLGRVVSKGSRRERGIGQVDARKSLQPAQAIAAQTTVRSAIAADVRDSYAPPVSTCMPKAANTSAVASAISAASGTDQRRRNQRPTPATT